VASIRACQPFIGEITTHAAAEVDADAGTKAPGVVDGDRRKGKAVGDEIVGVDPGVADIAAHVPAGRGHKGGRDAVAKPPVRAEVGGVGCCWAGNEKEHAGNHARNGDDMLVFFPSCAWKGSGEHKVSPQVARTSACAMSIRNKP
jgi:hypothetical protein